MGEKEAFRSLFSTVFERENGKKVNYLQRGQKDYTMPSRDHNYDAS